MACLGHEGLHLVAVMHSCDTHVLMEQLVMQGKNYIFSIKQTYRPVNPDGCSVVASKTKKNILITLSVGFLSCICNVPTSRQHAEPRCNCK